MEAEDGLRGISFYNGMGEWGGVWRCVANGVSVRWTMGLVCRRVMRLERA